MRESNLGSTTKGLVAFALALGLTVAPTLDLFGEPIPLHEKIFGMARVIDGDTILVSGVRIRLEGIDAPEADQTCKRKWFGSWACGAAATSALADRLRGKQVDCESRGVDKYGRVLAICHVDGSDINAWMVRQGLAWAFVKYSSAYLMEEAEAKAAKRGIWQGESIPAWEYRGRRWAMAEGQASEGCTIKGNVTRKGKIYHMPWSPWYGQIKMDDEKGKRWFCTEAEALAAGWRPVHVQ